MVLLNGINAGRPCRYSAAAGNGVQWNGMVRFREQLAIGVVIKMPLLKVNPLLVRATPFGTARLFCETFVRVDDAVRFGVVSTGKYR